MITGEDMDRLSEEHKEDDSEPKTKLLIVETQQFFEIEVPFDQDTDEYVTSKECKEICADKIISGSTDLCVERVYPTWNPITERWTF